jgi:uncharacterized protein involved in exopolysaccharide biosynthesis
VSQTGAKPQMEDALEPITLETSEEHSFALRVRAYGHLRLLWIKRRFLGKALVAGLLVGCIVAFLIPPRFESTVQLMPPDNQSTSGLAMLAALSSRGGGAGGGMGAVAGDLLGIKSSGALFTGVLNSMTVADRLSARFDLKKVYSIRLEEDVRRKLAKNSGITEDRKSGIISIAVTDRDPKRAAAMAEAYVEELNVLVAQLSTSSAHRERVFLEDRLKDVKRDLDDASLKFSQFASKNTAIDIKEQGRAMVEAAALLQGQLIAAESELKGLEQIYMSNNVRVRAVQARISELQAQLEKLGGKGIERQKSDASPALYPSIRELPILGVTYADLYRRTKIQEAVYETLTQQYELAKVQEAKETPSVKVLDAARVPERKSFPPRTAITCLGGVAFLALAVTGLFLRTQWTETDPRDPGKLLAQEVFQTVNGRMPWTLSNRENRSPELDDWNGSARNGDAARRQ